MELLILKCGDRYLRMRGKVPSLVGLDKASVFPHEQRDIVKQYERELRAGGFADIVVKKLVVTEEDFEG